MGHIFNIFKTVFICLFLHFVFVLFITSTDFSLDLTGFSIGLVIIIGISGYYAGHKDLKLSEIDAIFAAIITCSIVLLFISQYEALDKETNIYLYASYVILFYITSFIGSIIKKTEKKVKQEKLFSSHKIDTSD